MRSGILLAFLALATVARAQNEYQVTIDDFEADTLEYWQTSQSPEYYRGGEGAEGLEIVQMPEIGGVLRARVAFVDERANEPIWITRRLEEPIPARHLLSARVRYRIVETDRMPLDSLKLRLRTSPRAFNDYDILPEGGLTPGEWHDVVVDVRANMSMRNVYRNIFGEIQQVTLRVDDIDDVNAEFVLEVDEIVLTVEEPPEVEWEPERYDLRRDGRLDVLLLQHSAAGYYNIEQAARAIDPNARVDRYLFGGLHFPLWGFPETLEEMLGYDVIVAIDVDPWVMTQEQAGWLGSLVYSGAGMIFFGGPNTLTHAQDFRLPIRRVLPVTFEPGAEDVWRHIPPESTGHPLAAGLPAERLGNVSHLHALTPREDAQVVYAVADDPLLITGSFGDGRVALVNAWEEFGSTSDGHFLGTDLADDFVRVLLRWASNRAPEVQLTNIQLPPGSVVTPATVTVSAQATETASGIRLRVPGLGVEKTITGSDAGFEIALPAVEESEREIECTVEVLDRRGRVTDVRDFTIEAQNRCAVEVAWAAHQWMLEPGAQAKFRVDLRRRGLPSMDVSYSTLTLAFAEGALPVMLPGLADVWVYPPGSDTALHDQSGATDVQTTRENGLTPALTTTGVTHADRADMDFGEDDRIQRVERTARLQPDGGVRVDYRYEFVQNVRVQRISTMIALPTSTYAGLPFVAEQRDGTTEDTLPATTGRRIFDGHGLDLTIETERGPLRIQVPDDSLHVWMQDLRQWDIGAFRIEIEAPFEDATAEAGDTYQVPIIISGPEAGQLDLPALSDLTVDCALIDDRGVEALSWEPRTAADPLTYAERLPNLRSGEYRLRVVVREGNEPVVRETDRVLIVDPLVMEDFYPIMSVLDTSGGGHMMDREMALARVEDMWEHGLNAGAHVGATRLAADKLGVQQRVQNEAVARAMELGMATFFEYHSLTLLSREGMPVSPFTEEHRQRLRDRIEPQLDVCDRVARLLSIKILDEPHISAENLICEDRCREAFEERYGAPWRPVEEIDEDDILARWRLADFLGYYIEHAFAQTRELRDRHPGDYHLLLTYDSGGLGYGRSLSSCQDVLSWSRQAGMIDFDIYPYFYPASQKLRMVQADYGLCMMRSVAQYLGKPWGFYVELDDRNWPYQKNPAEATSETAFTAITHGANYLNTFIHRPFGTGVSSRPERWEKAGEAFRAIRRVGPLLTRQQRPPASVAMVYPYAQALIANGHRPHQYTLALLRQGFGMTDAISSEILVEQREPIERDAVLLLGCEILERDLAEKLIDYVRDGGRLIIDQVPEIDITGEPLGLPWDFDDAAERPFGALDDLTWRLVEDGDGAVVRLDFDIEEAYMEAIEQDLFARAAAMRRAVPELLGGATALCNAADAPGQMEAGVRLNQHAALVTVVNHHPERNEGTVEVNRLPFEPRWAVDMTTMQPIALDLRGEARCAFQAALAGRSAQMVAILPERPAGVDLDVATPEVQAGETLRYRARLLNEAGRTASGQHLLEISVIGPDGREVSRFGGSTATENGSCARRIDVPVNALPGRYEIIVRAPQINASVRGSFRVR